MSAVSEDRRLWLGGGVAVGVLLLLAGWLLLVQPQLTATADTRAQAEDSQLQNGTLAGTVSTLKAADKNLPTLVSALRHTREQLPITSGLSAFTDQLGAQAAAAKLTISSVTVGSVSVVTAAVAAPVAAAGGGAISEGTTATTGTAPAGTAGPAGQLYQVQLTLVTTGGLAQQRGFLAAVQAQGPRAALVTSVQLAATTDAAAATVTTGTAAVASLDTSAAMTTVLTVFVAPQTPAAAEQLAAQLDATPQR